MTTDEHLERIKDAIEKADAANWDGHYAGEGGITADYARAVHADALLGLESLAAIRQQIAEMERQREQQVKEWNTAFLRVQKLALAAQYPPPAPFMDSMLAVIERQIAALTAERDRQKAIAGEIRDELRITKRILAIGEEQSATLESTLRAIADATSEPGIAARVRAVLPAEVRAQCNIEPALRRGDVAFAAEQLQVALRLWPDSACRDAIDSALHALGADDESDALVIPEAMRDMDPQQRAEFVHRFNSLTGEEAMALAREKRKRDLNDPEQWAGMAVMDDLVCHLCGHPPHLYQCGAELPDGTPHGTHCSCGSRKVQP